jgi:hypothetical protein
VSQIEGIKEYVQKRINEGLLLCSRRSVSIPSKSNLKLREKEREKRIFFVGYG